MFSELVDDVTLNTKRGVDKVQTTQFANSTLRECQTTLGAVFENDLYETTIVTTSGSPFIWDKPPRFREMLAVQYPNRYFPRFVAPGKKIQAERRFFYNAATYFTFAGLPLNSEIHLAYFRLARRFQYYEVADRPAVYDFETETFTFHADYNSTPELQEQAIDLVSNWELIDWFDAIFSGTTAKVLKRAEDQKSGTAFAEYDAMRNTMRLSLKQVDIAAQSAGSNRIA